MTEPGSTPQTVGEVAALYLGNILYALETTAMTLERDDPAAGGEPAAFYRGIARLLAEARGREKAQS